MNERPYDDLISAYLDGELSPAEVVEVEKLLAESADARQLLEDFRALGTGLRSLPKLQLGVDFQERVLRQAERAALSGEAGAPAIVPLSIAPASDAARLQRFPRSWQSWKWATLATAAALAIWVFGRGPLEQGRQVAVAPEALREADRAPLPPADIQAASEPAPTASAEPSADSPAAARFTAPLADTLDAPAAPRGRDTAGAGPELLNQPAPSFAADEPPPPEAAARPLSEGLERAPERRAKVAASAPAENPAAAPAAFSADASKDSPAAATNRFDEQLELAPAAAKADGGFGILAGDTAQPSTDLLAIDVVAPQPAEASVALGQVLLQNSIMLEAAPAEMTALNSVAGGAGVNSLADSASPLDDKQTAAQQAAPLAASATAETAQLAADPSQAQLSAGLPAGPGSEENVETYYIEASEGQLQKTLEDLRAQPQMFYSVLQVDVPPEGPLQQAPATLSAEASPAAPAEDTGAAFRFEKKSATAEAAESVRSLAAPAADELSTAEGSIAETRGADTLSDTSQAAQSRGLAGEAEALSIAPADAREVEQEFKFREQATTLQQQAPAVQLQTTQQLGRAYRVNAPQSRGGAAAGYGRPAGGGYGAQAYGRARAELRRQQPGQAFQQQAVRQEAVDSFRADASAGVAAAGQRVLDRTKAGPELAPDPQRQVRALIFLRSAPPAAAAPASEQVAPAKAGD